MKKPTSLSAQELRIKADWQVSGQVNLGKTSNIIHSQIKKVAYCEKYVQVT